MAVGLDEQHTAYDRQQREKLASIGLNDHHAAYNHQQTSSAELGML